MIAARRSPTARRTRPIIVTSVVAAAGLLAGCSGSGSLLDAGNDPTTSTVATTTSDDQGPGSGGDSSTTDSSTTRAPTTSAVAVSDLAPCPTAALDAITDPVEVRFWHGMNGVNETAIDALVDEYNAGQDRVRVVADNQGGYEAVIDKFLQSSDGSRPDLVQIPEYGTQVMIDTGAIVPAQACIESSGYDTSSFLDIALRNYATAGVQWGLPFNLSDPVLYVNTKILEAAGLDPTTLPANFDELRATCEQIVASGAAPTCLSLDSGSDSGGGWFVEQWIANAGLAYADHDNGRTAPAEHVLWDEPGVVELVSFLAGMIDDGLAVYVGDNSSGQEQFLRMVSDQPAAMTIGTSAALGQVIDVLGGGTIPGLTVDDIGIGPLPGPGPTPTAVPGGAALYAVAGRDDAVVAGAWDFMRFLTSPQAQSTWAQTTGYIPVRSDAAELDPIASAYRDDPRYRVAFDQLVATADAPLAVAPLLGPMVQVRAALATAMAEIYGGGDVTATLADAAARADALIADYAARNGG
ncbi:MAG: ABC transporter substrate-binding protein [Ilumatobacteraceae bacterium]